ncbi:DNA ligase D [uncultured Paracoccus sp.]|uniref:DNA ligase D n=1 Tax=uncultured Paracoccus sp. TaxID=189685 RepID=UPI00260D0420|nr:DNA ligase D [uncultured Paracoccus sp.]
MDRLGTYRAKRDPARTAEPFDAGTPSSGALRYSMQNHDATRLHWDLRLEWNGVLLSWAVTRGPSFSPKEKRLAVRTEDHPIPYLTFEGTIPKGQYGAGTVMLWDIGSWRPNIDVEHGLSKGHLRLQLYGRRLTGAWDLVRIKGKPAEKRENWLLIKQEDAAAHQPDPVERYRTSVSTNRDFAAIAKDGPPVPFGPTRRLPRPRPVEPMLAKLVDAAPAGRGWQHEIKIDGYRGLVEIGAEGPLIRTRNGLDWSDRFSPLLPAFAELPARSALIDGEIVAGAGQAGFTALQQAIAAGGPFAYVAFDLLHLDGKDLTGKPLHARQAALSRLLADVPPMGLIEQSLAVQGDGGQALAAICAARGEGIVSKRVDAPYRSGRGDSWRKVKCEHRDDFLIVGWLPSTSPSRPFASLLLADQADDGTLFYRGKVGTGFDTATQDQVAAALAPLKSAKPALPVPRAEARGAKWLEPVLSAEIRYADITGDGRLRHASFQGLREDKMPTSRKTEKPVVRIASGPSGNTVEVAGITISNPDRIVYPDAGVTKGDVAAYYAAAADPMLTHLRDRPLSLVRLPEGLGGEAFFQKHAGKGFPKQIRETAIEGESSPALYVTDASGIVAAAQMGAIEFHIRGVHRDRPDRPDRLVFDLDPDEGLGWSEVQRAAFDLHDRLERLGLPSWAMVTGGKGVHVVCEIKRTVPWDTATLFARTLTSLMADEEPDRFVAVMSKAKRSGKIFIDWLRNQPQSTAITPFSLRARPGATVAVPVSWKVLEGLDGADGFTIRDALDRAPSVAPQYPKPVALTPAIRALTG